MSAKEGFKQLPGVIMVIYTLQQVVEQEAHGIKGVKLQAKVLQLHWCDSYSYLQDRSVNY